MYVIEEKKLARLKAGHPFPMVGPTSSVAGPTFLHIKTLPPPARRNNQSMRGSGWPRSQLFLVYRRCNINGSLGPDEVSENMFGVEYKHVHSVEDRFLLCSWFAVNLLPPLTSAKFAPFSPQPWNKRGPLWPAVDSLLFNDWTIWVIVSFLRSVATNYCQAFYTKYIQTSCLVYVSCWYLFAMEVMFFVSTSLIFNL